MLKVLVILGLALRGYGLGNSSQGAAHLGAALPTNVARHRPCKPRPACMHLVDGLLNLTHESQVSALARSSQSSPLLIFLKAPTLVSQIVVHLVHHGRPGAGRHLMISLWKNSSEGDLGPPTKRWLWDPQKAVDLGSLKVVVPVDRVASAVAVSWESTLEDSSEAEMWISEVLVLQSAQRQKTSLKTLKTLSLRDNGEKALEALPKALPQEPQEALPQELPQELLQKAVPQNEFSTSVQIHNFAPEAAELKMGELGVNGVKNGSRAFRDPHFNHFLSPFPQPTGLRFSLKACLGALLAFILLAFKYKSYAEKAFWNCRDTYASLESYDESYDYDPVPRALETPPEPFEESDVESSRARSFSETASEPEGEPFNDHSAELFEKRQREENEREDLKEDLRESSLENSLESSRSSERSHLRSGEEKKKEKTLEKIELKMLYASPLCFQHGREMKPLPQLPIEKEFATLLAAYAEASELSGAAVALKAETLTAQSLQRALTAATPPVLHLSSHGVRDCLVLEDGNGTAHFFSCAMLRGMLELATKVRLVVLNACSLSEMGSEFVSFGVPHVVCCSADLKDSLSHVFFRSFYSELFQSASVDRAFHSALIALRSHSERSAQAASHHFQLLPEGRHEEVLFPKDLEAEARRRQRGRPSTCLQVQSSLGRQLPSLPEDFIGRELDVWSVLQQLNQRRAVVVCSTEGEDFGVGKTAVLDAVHRAFTLLGHTCVAIHLRSLSQASWAGEWIDKASAAVRGAIREREYGTRATGASRRRRLQGPVRTGFHALSDPLTTACLLEDFIEELLKFADLCDYVEWTSPKVLLLLDECDHLVQQQQFQEALACILQRCPSYSVVLSTHQPMVVSGASKFKVVQHRLEGLAPRDSARLLLRRAQRPLRWGEVRKEPGPGSCSVDPNSLVIMNKENESEVLDAVASHPRVAALRGNPRRLIELANHLDSLTEF